MPVGIGRSALFALLLLMASACEKGPEPAEPSTEEGAEEQTAETPGEESPGEEAPAVPEAREDITLTLWHSYRGDEETALGQVLELFNNSHPHTTIEALAIPFDAYPDRITAAIPRGRGPDFFIFAHDRIGDWADENIIESINYWTDDELLDQFFENTVQALVYNRGLYGLPLAFKSVVLFYNPNLIPTPPTTTDEMIAMAAPLTSQEGDGQYGLVYQYNLIYFHGPWLHGFGGRIMDEAGNLELTSEGAVASVAFAQSLYQQHHLLPENAFSQTVVTLFNSGRAGMVISGPWFIAELLEDTPWAVAPLPTVSATGQPARPFMSSEAIILSALSENKERAFEAARWMATNPEANRIRMEVGHQPVALRAAYEGEVDPVIQVFRDQMLSSVSTPNTPLMRQVWGHVDTALFNAIKNNANPSEVMQTAQQRIMSE